MRGYFYGAVGGDCTDAMNQTEYVQRVGERFFWPRQSPLGRRGCPSSDPPCAAWHPSPLCRTRMSNLLWSAVGGDCTDAMNQAEYVQRVGERFFWPRQSLLGRRGCPPHL